MNRNVWIRRLTMESVRPLWSDCFISIQQYSSLCGLQQCTLGMQKAFCFSGALNNYIAYIGFICIFCCLPVEALNLGSLYWISALLLAHVCSVFCHRIVQKKKEKKKTWRESSIHFVITNTVSAAVVCAPVQTSTRFSWKRFGKSDEWNNLFSFKKEVNCICI